MIWLGFVIGSAVGFCAGLFVVDLCTPRGRGRDLTPHLPRVREGLRRDVY